MDRIKLAKYSVAVLVVLASFVFCWSVFDKTAIPQLKQGVVTDELSGDEVNMSQINSDAGPNPYAPYFAGFGALTKYGVSNDDFRYIQDFLINYTLYRAKIHDARISYVDKSFRGPVFKGTAGVYSFKFGINDKDVKILDVSSDTVTKKINLSVKDGDKTIFTRAFDVYSTE